MALGLFVILQVLSFAIFLFFNNKLRLKIFKGNTKKLDSNFYVKNRNFYVKKIHNNIGNETKHKISFNVTRSEDLNDINRNDSRGFVRRTCLSSS